MAQLGYWALIFLLIRSNTQSYEHKFIPETKQYPMMFSSTNTMNNVKSEPKYEHYLPSLDRSHFKSKPLQNKTFQSMNLSITPKPLLEESLTPKDVTFNPQLFSIDDHVVVDIMPNQFPFLSYRAADPDTTPTLSFSP